MIGGIAKRAIGKARWYARRWADSPVRRLPAPPLACQRTALYATSYNSPDQFARLIASFVAADPAFLQRPDLYLIDTSSDPRTLSAYAALCAEHGFTHIKVDNPGINGARQLAADHFDASGCDYTIYFEDDMLLHAPTDKHCRCGFRIFIDHLYDRSLAVMQEGGFDFLKLSYAEVYGTNDEQWAWINLAPNDRSVHFPGRATEHRAYDYAAIPRTRVSARKRAFGLGYREGEFHYGNWPLWFSKSGNRKLFMEERLPVPLEEQWMVKAFGLQRQKILRAGVLHLSPVNHCRTVHYPPDQRRLY